MLFPESTVSMVST